MEIWLSIVAAIASIASAIWAFLQARKSSKFASKAELIKKELINHRVITEISTLQSQTYRILKTVSQVGPTSTEISLQGIDCSKVAKEVEEYLRFLNEHREQFGSKFAQEAKSLYDELNPIIEKLSDAKIFEDKKKYGKEIYYRIDSMSPIIKRIFEGKKEKVIT